MKIVGRGDTTVVDAYLSPILRRYVTSGGRRASGPGVQADVHAIERRADRCCAVSRQRRYSFGPGGGIVGAARTAEAAGFGHIISFDMGGTSTDVAHYAGELSGALKRWWQECGCVRP